MCSMRLCDKLPVNGNKLAVYMLAATCALVAMSARARRPCRTREKAPTAAAAAAVGPKGLSAGSGLRTSSRCWQRAAHSLGSRWAAGGRRASCSTSCADPNAATLAVWLPVARLPQRSRQASPSAGAYAQFLTLLPNLAPARWAAELFAILYQQQAQFAAPAPRCPADSQVAPGRPAK